MSEELSERLFAVLAVRANAASLTGNQYEALGTVYAVLTSKRAEFLEKKTVNRLREGLWSFASSVSRQAGRCADYYGALWVLSKLEESMGDSRWDQLAQRLLCVIHDQVDLCRRRDGYHTYGQGLAGAGMLLHRLGLFGDMCHDVVSCLVARRTEANGRRLWITPTSMIAPVIEQRHGPAVVYLGINHGQLGVLRFLSEYNRCYDRREIRKILEDGLAFYEELVDCDYPDSLPYILSPIGTDSAVGFSITHHTAALAYVLKRIAIDCGDSRRASFFENLALRNIRRNGLAPSQKTPWLDVGTGGVALMTSLWYKETGDEVFSNLYKIWHERTAALVAGEIAEMPNGLGVDWRRDIAGGLAGTYLLVGEEDDHIGNEAWDMVFGLPPSRPQSSCR